MVWLVLVMAVAWLSTDNDRWLHGQLCPKPLTDDMLWFQAALQHLRHPCKTSCTLGLQVYSMLVGTAHYLKTS